MTGIYDSEQCNACTNQPWVFIFPLKVSFTKNKKEVNVDELLSQTTYVMVIDG